MGILDNANVTRPRSRFGDTVRPWYVHYCFRPVVEPRFSHSVTILHGEANVCGWTNQRAPHSRTDDTFRSAALATLSKGNRYVGHPPGDFCCGVNPSRSIAFRRTRSAIKRTVVPQLPCRHVVTVVVSTWCLDIFPPDNLLILTRFSLK